MLPRMNDKSVRGSKRFARVEVANRPSLRIRVGATSFEEPAMERDEGEPLDLFGPRPHRVPAETSRAGHAHPMDGARPPPMADRGTPAARAATAAAAEPDAFELLATRAARGRLPHDRTPGEGPQSREKPAGGPPHEEHPALPFRERECDADHGSARPHEALRISFRVPVPVRPATGAERARPAEGGPRATHGRTEFHEGLVVRARFRERDETLRDSHQPPARIPARDITGDAEHAREHAGGVPIDRGHPLSERDARDRARRVVPDSRELPQRRERPRDLRAVARDDRLRGAVQMAGPPVESESLPRLQHLFLRGVRQVDDGGEAGDEPLEIRNAGGDGGPLEEDLRHEDRVRVPRAVEGEIPPMLAIPREQPLGEGVFHQARNDGLLQNRSGAPTEEEKVELCERDPNRVRERPPAVLDPAIPAGRQGLRNGPDDAVADEVPQDVAVENREAVREADVPEEVGRLFHGEAVDLAHEPLARGLGGRERRERRLEGPLPAGPESVPRRDEVCGLVVVEPDAGTEELRDRGC